MIGLDPRSLAVFRIGLGLTLLLDLAIRSMDVRAMYSGDGFLEMERSIKMSGPMGWSLHWISGELWFQSLLLAIAALLATGVVLGWRTRWMVIGSFVLLASIHTRNPVILNGGDGMVRAMLFWAMFLPLGRVWSLDARRLTNKGRPPPLKPVVSMATFCLIVQLCVIYWFAGTAKLNEVWLGFDAKEVWQDPSKITSISLGGSAMERALHYDMYEKPLAGVLLHAPWLLRVICLGTLFLEIIGPCLLFIPFRTRWWRLIVVASFALLHIGIELTLHVGMFTWISLSVWAALLPAMVWESSLVRRLAPWKAGQPSGGARKPMGEFVTLRQFISYSTVLIAVVLAHAIFYWIWGGEWTIHCCLICVWAVSLGIHIGSSPSVSVRRIHNAVTSVSLAIMVNLALVTFFAVAMAWNFSYSFEKDDKTEIQRFLRPVANTMMLRQRWNMFSKPVETESWFVYRAELTSGEVVDIQLNGQPVSMEKPADLSSNYANHRWRKLHVNLATKRFKRYREPVADYLCRRWNETHGPDQQIETLKLYKLTEKKGSADECSSALCLTITPDPQPPESDNEEDSSADESLAATR